MHPPVLFLHPFDAKAGSQRVGAMLVRLLRNEGLDVKVALGFGSNGFLSAQSDVTASFAIESVKLRKLLYPLWLIIANLRSAFAVAKGKIIWANTVHALPAVLPALLFRPGKLVVHIHELQMPGLFRTLLAWAFRRKAILVAVSQHQADHLRLPCRILWNAVGALPPIISRVGHNLVWVGDWRPFKGFDLFVAIAEAGTPFNSIAILGGSPEQYPPSLLSRADAAGIDCRFGMSDPGAMLEGAILALQLSDSRQVDETFSLTAAEAVWNLVPVGAAGSEAVAEVAGPALAFNLNSRDPAEFAAAIRELAADPENLGKLRESCRAVQPDLSEGRYLSDLLSILAAGKST